MSFQRSIPLLVLALLLSLSACEKAAQIQSAANGDSSPWQFSDATDKMTGKRVVSAKWENRKDGEASVVMADTSVVCDGNYKYGRLYLLIRTLKSSPDNKDSNIVDGIGINFDDDKSKEVNNIVEVIRQVQQNPSIIGLNAPIKSASDFIPLEYLELAEIDPLQAAMMKVRVNENSNPEGPFDILAVSTKFNNEIRVFADSVRLQTSSDIQTLRIAIPTQQGDFNYLFDFKDPNVKKVLDSCPESELVSRDKKFFRTVRSSGSSLNGASMDSIFALFAGIQKGLAEQAQATAASASTTAAAASEGLAPASSAVAPASALLAPAVPNAGLSASASIAAPSTPASEATPVIVRSPALVGAGPAGRLSPSFDCTKAASHVEKLICSDGGLAALDVQMNDAYHKAVATAADATSLKSAQREWVKSDRNACTDVACLAAAYRNRIDAIKGSAKH